MSNPWTKKNPLLSLWLSGANAAAGAARSRASATGKRQASALMNEGARQMTRFWTAGLLGTPTKRTKRR